MHAKRSRYIAASTFYLQTCCIGKRSSRYQYKHKSNTRIHITKFGVPILVRRPQEPPADRTNHHTSTDTPGPGEMAIHSRKQLQGQQCSRQLDHPPCRTRIPCRQGSKRQIFRIPIHLAHPQHQEYQEKRPPPPRAIYNGSDSAQ